MTLLRGARELGLKVKWRYGFLGPDEPASPAPGVLYLDLGGKVLPGVLDHHHGIEKDTCTASLVLANRDLVYGHLLGPWLARHEEGRISQGTVWQPTLVTHRDPDWDSVVAAFLVQELVEHGEFPAAAEALARYARLVDQGLFPLFARAASVDWDAELLSKRLELFAPHLAYLAIQNVESLGGDHPGRLRLGLELIRRVLADLEVAGLSLHGLGPDDFRPVADSTGAEHPAARWRGDARFAEAESLLRKDAWEYREDRVARESDLGTVLLPASDGGEPIPVRSFVLTRPPRSKLNKYWVRAEGHPFFVCPYAPRIGVGDPPSGGRVVYPRVVISLDASYTTPEGRKPTLRGLGFRLEREEARERAALDPLGRGTDDRGLPARFPPPYCSNADPWYDGRGHDHTIVDAPRCGTVLPYEAVVRLATRERFWELPLAAGSAVVVKVASAAPEQPTGRATSLANVDGWASPMDAYTRRVCDWPGEIAPESASGCVSIRRFRRAIRERGASTGVFGELLLDVTQIDVRAGATLDGLVGAIVAEGAATADHSFALFRLDPDFIGSHFLVPGRLEWLMRNLDAGAPVLSDAGARDVVVYGGQKLALEPLLAAVHGSDPIRTGVETFLYSVFLAESLARFSGQIAKCTEAGADVPGGARALRLAFVDFQTQLYQLDVSRSARGRGLAAWLGGVLRLPEHYDEVRSELDRLNELEERAADERRRRADDVLGVILLVIAGFGVVQTLMGFWNHPSSLWARGLLCAAVALALVAGYALARRALRAKDRR